MAKSKSNHKPKRADGPQNRKLLGSRIETIIEKLSPMQVEEERAKVCDAYVALEALKEERKKITADVKARIAAKEQEQKLAGAAVASARRSVEVTIEEWLTDDNQVMRIRTDTGELLGTRTARPPELQEELPLDEPDEEPPEELGQEPFGGA